MAIRLTSQLSPNDAIIHQCISSPLTFSAAVRSQRISLNQRCIRVWYTEYIPRKCEHTWFLSILVRIYGLPRTSVFVLSPLWKLTHCGPVKPYADIDLVQHRLRWWLVAWRHRDIKCSKVDQSSVGFCCTHLEAISHERLKISNLDMDLKITNLRL